MRSLRIGCWGRICRGAAVFMFVALFLSGCGGGGGGSTPASNVEPPQATVESLSVTPQSLSLVAGQTTQLQVLAHYSDGTDQAPSSPQWSSSDIQCATVDAAGLLSAIGSGTAVITVSFAGRTTSLTLTVTEPVVNLPPVAQAGSDRTVLVLTSVTLDGSFSTDPNGDPISYSWSVVSVPEGSSLTDAGLVGADLASVGFTPDMEGNFVLQLVVHDATLDSAPDQVTVSAVTMTGAGLLPVTGQKEVYLPGDDGDLQSGMPWPKPRFSDNGDGTVTDHLTGLMWLKDANCIRSTYPAFDTDNMWDEPTVDGAVTWGHALDFVAGINSGTYSSCGGGYADWHLPNRREMRSLLDVSQDSPILPLGHPFVNVPIYTMFSDLNTDYWTSTSDPDYPSSVITVNIMDGETWPGYKDSGEEVVWPVRTTGATPVTRPFATGQTLCYDQAGAAISCAGTGQDGELQRGTPWPDPRFTDNGNGTVTDNLTGLVWLQDANCIATAYPQFDPAEAYEPAGDGAVYWDQALDFVAGINAGTYPDCGAGYADWRLPNLNEMESLLNDGTDDEAAWLGQVFENLPADSTYWSSTTDSGFDINAWFVGLSPGNSYRDQQSENKPTSRYLWPVRFPTESNYPPVVGAGIDQYALTGKVVNLEGASYDSGEGPLTYQWTLVSSPAGSATTLSGADTLTPSLTADLPGDYLLSLVADDGELQSQADTVTVHANVINCSFDNPSTLGTSGVLETSLAGDIVPLCDGWVLSANTTDDRIELHNVFTEEFERSVPVDGSVRDMEFDDESGLLYAVKTNLQNLSRVDMEAGTTDLISLPSVPLDLALAGNDRLFVSLKSDPADPYAYYSSIGLVNGASGSVLKTWDDASFSADSILLAYDRSGQQLVTGEVWINPAELKRYHFDEGAGTLTLLGRLDNAGTSAGDLQLSPDGRHLAFTAGSGNASSGPYTIFDFSTDDFATVFGEWATGAYPRSGSFSPDGNYLVATNGSAIQLFDVASHNLLAEYPVSCNGLLESDMVVRFSRGGDILFAYGTCTGASSSTGRIFWQVIAP